MLEVDTTQIVGVEQLTEASLMFTKAANNYGAMNVVFGICMMMMLVLLAAFLRQVWSMQKNLGTIKEASDTTLEYLSSMKDRTVGKEEAKALIREALSLSEALCKYYVLKIRLEHHTSDKTFTEEKVKAIVSNDLSRRKEFLSRFRCSGKPVEMTVTDDDAATTTKLVLDWVYKDEESFSVALMAQAVELYFDGVKITAQGRIDEIGV